MLSAPQSESAPVTAVVTAARTATSEHAPNPLRAHDITNPWACTEDEYYENRKPQPM